MRKVFDTGLKDLFAQWPADLGGLLRLGGLTPYQLLPTNLVINLDTDLVLGFGSPLSGVIDINFQTAWDGETLVRVFVYNPLLFREYRVPVHSVVVLLRAHNDARLDAGVRYAPWPERGAVSFVPEVVRIWERPVEELLTGGLGLLPLATLGQVPEGMTRLEALPEILRRIDERLAKEATPEQAHELANWTYNLTGIHFRRVQVESLFPRRSILLDSMTFQDTLEQGAVNEVRKNSPLGTRKLGPAGDVVRSKLTAIEDLERLERMLDAILTATTWQEVMDTE